MKSSCGNMIQNKSLLFSDQYRMLSGSGLKILAMVTMVIDHVDLVFLRYQSEFITPLCTLGGKNITAYFLLRCVGRLSFPLFAFLLVEGFQHTSNRRKYARNLLVFAFVSEIPFDLMRFGEISALEQNVFFTLFLGILALFTINRWEKGCTILPCHSESSHLNGQLAICLFSLIGASMLIHTDYGSKGVCFIILLYVLRHSPVIQAAVGCLFLPWGWITGLAFIPINLYNGKRGFIQGAVAKYFFYAFYPLHMIAIYFIKCYLL